MIDVEIYDERETSIDGPEPDEEALALIEELGLTAQVEDGGRITYPEPTEAQAMVLMALFPTVTRVDRYDAGAIPLRVLKEIRSFRSEHHGTDLYVCHQPPAKIDDPVLVSYSGTLYGSDTESLFRFGGKVRLVARWGDALRPWAELYDDAMQVVGKRLDDMAEKIMSIADRVRKGRVAVSRMPEISNLPD